MPGTRVANTIGIVVISVLLAAAPAAAQNTGIAGVVKDASGAVLPGVTVEAESAALIERVRTVTTDGRGLYSIIDLRPGTYTVTFTLPGFSTVRREGVELTGSFTATVNADLQVGALSETLTVSGEAPAVDTRNVVQLKVLSDEMREALPTGRSIQYMSELIPGVTITTTVGRPHDVAGTSDTRGASMIHGGRSSDYMLQLDGTPTDLGGSGGSQSWQVNPAETQEFVYELGALSAESQAGGVRANVIPKEGGNRYTGYGFGAFSNQSFQSSNLTQKIRDLGVPTPNRLRKHWDANTAAGGPLKRDRLWFFTSYRNQGQDEEVIGMYKAIDPRSFVFDATKGAAGNVDLTRPALYEARNNYYSARFTWQASAKNKIAIYWAEQPRHNYGFTVTGTTSYEAGRNQDFNRNQLIQVAWKSPMTSKLLFEVTSAANYMTGERGETVPGLERSDIISVTDSGTGFTYRAPSAGFDYNYWNHPSAKAAVSYVTGAHAAKFGFAYEWGYASNTDAYHNQNMNFTFRNGVPIQITVFNDPRVVWPEWRKQALFAQDQWTVKRFTVNGGLRLDFQQGSISDRQTSGPNQYAPFQRWPEITNVPNWKDVSPRFGVAYDLFGNGRTALKYTLNRYVVSEGTAFPASVNPITFNLSATRPWTDANRDFIPQESELGTLSNSAFGTAATTTRVDDAIREGWGVRQYNWETSASIQQQLIEQLSINIGFTRRWYNNFTVSDNLALTPADFDEFCVIAPADSRLGGVSGSRVCGLYDLNPAKRTVTPNILRTDAEQYGTQKEIWQGFDLLFDARLPGRANVSGGVNTGTAGNNTEACFVVDSPGALRFCDVRRWTTNLRLLGSIELPWGFNAGVTYQDNPGPEMLANYTVTSAQVGSVVQFVNPARTTFSGGSAVVSLIEPGTMYQDRLRQLDMRLSKSFRTGGLRTRFTLDLANMLNAAAVITHNTTYGSSWLRPTYVLQGRIIKPGVQIDF